MLVIPVLAGEFRPRQLTRAHPDDAGYDLCASEAVRLSAGRRELVPTGVQLAIPEGYVGLICPRSGLALKKGVTVLNAPGIVDAGYRGDVGVVLANFGDEAIWIEPGDAVAQLLIVQLTPITFLATPELPDSARSTGGFGSTGT